MTTEELRDVIWDYLFQNKTAKSIGELALLSGYDATSVSAAVDHEWFRLTDDQVSVAYSPPAQNSVAN